MFGRRLLAIMACVSVLGVTSVGIAADHLDSPSVQSDPTSDITDLYAWMNADASKVNLALDVMPNAGTDATFSTAVQYVIHVTSLDASLESAVESTIICQFYEESSIECWVGDQGYITGDPSAEAGITNDDESVKLFAGLRNDPFFMEFAGFQDAVSTVLGAIPSLTFDDAGCPTLDTTTSQALVGQLQGSETDAGTATDTFEGQNVLSIVMQVDKGLLTSADQPILAVWASTRTVQ